jgi:DedD protein
MIGALASPPSQRMGLFSFLQRSTAPDASRAGTPDPVQAARSRARRRLIGAAVLLGVGVIGFPLLFETQPRPIPVDIAIDIPRKDNAPSLPLPPPRTASAAPATARISSGVISEPRREAPAASATAAPPAPRTEAPARSETPPRSEAPQRTETPPKSEARSESATTVANKPVAKPDARSDDGSRARSLLEGQAASSPGKPITVAAADAGKAATDATTKSDAPKADAAGRFVVQVGAYGEAASARDMRQRVDKLGLKTYTQVVDIDGAKRIRVRVGPFAAREDAEKAAGTLKAAGLPAAVMTL